MASSEGVVRAIEADFRPGFAETRVTLRPEGEDLLQLDTTTHFTDGSGPRDYAATTRV